MGCEHDRLQVRIVKSVYFLARAYNDIDCRLPLLLEFARDANYDVTIIGIPTNVGLQDPKLHELHAFAVKHCIAVTTIYEFADAGMLLRSMYLMYARVAGCMVMGKIPRRLQHYLTSTIFRAVRWLSIRNRSFVSSVFEKIESSIVIADEVIFHGGRSFFIDALYATWKTHRAFQLCAFVTGQDPYIDLWKDKAWGDMPVYSREAVGIPLFVPGPNDAQVMSAQLSSEDIVIAGNTRFDKSWVALRASLSQKAKAAISLPSGVEARVLKVVFMLSKLEYGVEVVNLVDTMNRCAALDNAVVIVKPHTRGMELEALGHAYNHRIVDGSDYSSSDLIEWADFVLFTGSSIAFHALISAKKVIYLKYCQRYRSIYDTSKAMMVANSVEGVLGYLTSPDSFRLSEMDVQRFLDVHVYNGNESGMVCQAIKARIEALSSRRG